MWIHSRYNRPTACELLGENITHSCLFSDFVIRRCSSTRHYHTNSAYRLTDVKRRCHSKSPRLWLTESLESEEKSLLLQHLYRCPASIICELPWTFCDLNQGTARDPGCIRLWKTERTDLRGRPKDCSPVKPLLSIPIVNVAYCPRRSQYKGIFQKRAVVHVGLHSTLSTRRNE